MSEDETIGKQKEVRDYYGIKFSGRGYTNVDKYVAENFDTLTVTDMSRETGISRSTIQANCRKLGLYKFKEGKNLEADEEVKELSYPWEKYVITSKGRLINRETGFVKKPFKKLGYLRYEIYRDGKYMSVSQHRLLADNFIPNPENRPEVNHIDGCRDNNSIRNLEWVTHGENMEHARYVLRKPGMYGETNNFASITEKQAKELITCIKSGKRNPEIIKEFPYATKGILDGIRYNGNWSHLQ